MTEENQANDEIDLPGKDEVFDATVISVPPVEPEPITLPGAPGERQPVSITRIAHSSVLIDFAGKLVRPIRGSPRPASTTTANPSPWP